LHVSKNYIPGDRCCLNFCIWLIQAQFWKQIFLNLQIFCYFSSVCHCSHPIDPHARCHLIHMGPENFFITKTMQHYHPLFKVLIVKWKTLEGDEITWRSPNFVTLYRKMNFRGLGSAQGQNNFGQCLGLCNTDFNTEKNHGVLWRKFGEKKCFRPKVWRN